MSVHDISTRLDGQGDDDEAWADEQVDEEAEAAADAEGLADIEAGRTISWEAVKRWMQSWGTPDELPHPQVGD